MFLNQCLWSYPRRCITHLLSHYLIHCPFYLMHLVSSAAYPSRGFAIIRITFSFPVPHVCDLFQCLSFRFPACFIWYPHLTHRPKCCAVNFFVTAICVWISPQFLFLLKILTFCWVLCPTSCAVGTGGSFPWGQGIMRTGYGTDHIPPRSVHINHLVLEMNSEIVAHNLCKMWIFYEPK